MRFFFPSHTPHPLSVIFYYPCNPVPVEYKIRLTSLLLLKPDWLDGGISDQALHIENYTIIRDDCNRHDGGITFFYILQIDWAWVLLMYQLIWLLNSSMLMLLGVWQWVSDDPLSAWLGSGAWIMGHGGIGEWFPHISARVISNMSAAICSWMLSAKSNKGQA